MDEATSAEISPVADATSAVNAATVRRLLREGQHV
jgi:hypothetical protein